MSYRYWPLLPLRLKCPEKLDLHSIEACIQTGFPRETSQPDSVFETLKMLLTQRHTAAVTI